MLCACAHGVKSEISLDTGQSKPATKFLCNILDFQKNVVDLCFM